MGLYEYIVHSLPNYVTVYHRLLGVTSEVKAEVDRRGVNIVNTKNWEMCDAFTQRIPQFLDLSFNISKFLSETVTTVYNGLIKSVLNEHKC